MRGYELSLIFHADTSDTDIATIVQDISDLITRQKGSVIKHEKWGKKNLKYPIKKQTKGNYYFLYFMAEPPVLREIDRLIRYNEAILRSATLALDKRISPDQILQQSQAAETIAVFAEQNEDTDTSAPNQTLSPEA